MLIEQSIYYRISQKLMSIKTKNIQNINRHENILKDERYLKLLSDVEELEKNRIFCKHDISHSMDVARIATIIWLEDGKAKELKRDIIYATGLLHDIGRAVEYKEGRPHDEASAEIAAEILPDCGYLPSEISEISQAIIGHRGRNQTKNTYLGEIIARADKLSRGCFLCNAREECKWSENDKNDIFIY